MQNLKQIRKWIPELYLLASALFYWVSTSTLLNPFAIFLVLVLSSLFIWKSKTLGVVVGLLFLILSLYMILALMSELSEFSTFNSDAKAMLGIGAAWLGLNIILASMMLAKWGKYQSIPKAAIHTPIA